MKVSEAVLIYVEQKRLNGADFSKSFQSLRSFSAHAGDISMSEVEQRHISSFLDGPLTSTVTWRSKYGLLRHFFLYWVARDEVSAAPLPVPRAAAIQTFVPYIYTRSELYRLFAAVRISQKSDACKLDAATLRTYLILLYATGALMSEGLGLQRKDVDLRRRHITIKSARANRSREIPIGEDLCRVLKLYRDARHGKNPDKSLPFFATIAGEPVNKVTIAKSFQRARTVSGIVRTDGSQYQPRLHDLRHTFAVHRMTSWIRHGADMNRMMPALAAYLGQMELESTERYLKMTPERFRTQLNILSPNKTKRHWRDNASLMRFVDAL
jgi:integrase/recombinase XerD